ncbi:hypothetical protein FVEN_g12867 [Fusarium venenatum]|uniref:Mid2 domain-containing protein n=1 Tax=Fusarium venenatum TaxID=56646 RepID=A0A2L2TBQ0_9HYPO|nr:uncharacterized protein FVRRES_04812 [Fusarium venenatum]KAG8355661.1 hypothetical protein FVEN_g12867 [Fusarium venenatum]KAH6991956.1 hypothetical protein EDB82DRAFT_535113 [Fusarium venenatum]CEI60376.1 unnamed protein product [Fusarium venenatum]
MNKRLQLVIFIGLLAVKDSFSQVLGQASQTGEMDTTSDATATPDITSEIVLGGASSTANTIVVTIASDETCGFLSGRPTLPITCENNRPCMWASDLGILCGNLDNGNNFDIHFRCVDRDTALNPNLCNDTCVGNTVNLLCTNESAPHCATYAFPQGIQDFRCSSTPATRVSTVSFTYSGQEDASFATTTIDLNADSVSKTSGTEIKASSTSAISTSSSSATSDPPSSSQNNLGAIIGGAVGGFAAISLVIFGIVWFVRQSRKKTRQSIPMNQMEQDPLSDPNVGKTGPTSSVPSDWRNSTMTALSSPNSASPQAWMNQPVSPSAQSDASQGMMPTMGQNLTYEMSGESVQPPQEMGDNRVYEMDGHPDRHWV